MIPIIRYKGPFVGIARNGAGFTLIELIITVVIAGILVALAAPAMTTFIQNQRISSQTNEMIADLSFARSEALKRATAVTVCKSNNPTANPPLCNPTVADAWTAGRVVFSDGSTIGTIDAGDTVLRVRERLEGAANRIVGDGTTNGTGNRITYLGSGATNLVAVNASDVENQVFVCDRRGPTEGRAIAIRFATGRVRVTQKGTNMNGGAISTATCPAS